MAMTDWDERIPVAIANAERMLDGYEWKCFEDRGRGIDNYLTAGELAAVKALWRVTMAEGWHIDPALREFTEKIEQVEQ